MPEPASGTRPSPARRACAAVALTALAAAVVVVVVSLARDPLEMVVALMLLAFTTEASWAAIVRRGLPRVVAAAAACAALVGLAALPDLRTFLLLATVIGLLALSTLTSRIAFGRDLAATRTGIRVAPARRGALLMNPRSGDGKVGRFRLEDEARRRGITPVLLAPGDDLRTLAERTARRADVIGMAGGDGSQALVADVARRYGIPYVCVPAGTRNHFALDLGLDREDVVAALDAFGEAVERVVDLAVLGDRVFVNNASIGVYATVVQSPEYRDAKVSTVAGQLPDLLGPGSARLDLSFTWPAGVDQRPADVLLVSNGVYRLERLSGFGTRERLDGGNLGIVAVTVDRAGDLPALISAEITGRLARFRGYRAWQATEFVVYSGQSLVDVGLDGEALRLPPPLRFRVLPGAVRVRVPVNAPGAPSAPPQGLWRGRSVGALFRVLAGRPDRRTTSRG
jgi:diacylglycerol kinase family enzyme